MSGRLWLKEESSMELKDEKLQNKIVVVTNSENTF